MRALTVRSPWAWAIARGWKPVENRGRPFPPSLVGVPIAVHAGLGRDDAALPDPEAAEALCRALAENDPLAARGTVVAVVRFGLSHLDPAGGECSAWALKGAWHWPIESAVPLAEPVACRGALGFWRLPGDVLAAVHRNAAKAAGVPGP